MPENPKLVMDHILLHAFFKMSHRRVLTLDIVPVTIGNSLWFSLWFHLLQHVAAPKYFGPTGTTKINLARARPGSRNEIYVQEQERPERGRSVET